MEKKTKAIKRSIQSTPVTIEIRFRRDRPMFNFLMSSIPPCYACDPSKKRVRPSSPIISSCEVVFFPRLSVKEINPAAHIKHVIEKYIVITIPVQYCTLGDQLLESFNFVLSLGAVYMILRPLRFWWLTSARLRRIQKTLGSLSSRSSVPNVAPEFSFDVGLIREI